MRRRTFISLLGIAVATQVAPAAAQQKTIPVIGFLSGRSPGEAATFVSAFRQGLAEAPYVEGQNVAIEYRWAEGRYDRLPGMAAELVSRKVDVIVTSGGNAAALAAKSASATIPIVFISGGDPVATNLVGSLGSPNGNLTGVSFLLVELHPKRLELVSELVPQAGAIDLLVNPTNPNTAPITQDVREAAVRRGVHLHISEAGTEADIGVAFRALGGRHADALLIGADPFFLSQRYQLVALAARHSIPAIYFDREFAVAGGLISYGTNITAVYRQAGVYAGKVLGGAKPVDLPVEQPTKFELVINLKTAKALGLTVPQSLLARADEVIE
jgi:putative tryptophan/tyrosine transport system substrate-binding protein